MCRSVVRDAEKEFLSAQRFAPSRQHACACRPERERVCEECRKIRLVAATNIIAAAATAVTRAQQRRAGTQADMSPAPTDVFRSILPR